MEQAGVIALVGLTKKLAQSRIDFAAGRWYAVGRFITGFGELL